MFSPSGKRVVVGLKDESIIVQQFHPDIPPSTIAVMHGFFQERGSFFFLTFGGQDDTVIATGLSGEIKVWETGGNGYMLKSEHKTTINNTVIDDRVNYVQYEPCRAVLFGSVMNRNTLGSYLIIFTDPHNGQVLRTLAPVSGWRWSLHPNQRCYIGEDSFILPTHKKVCIWDIESGAKGIQLFDCPVTQAESTNDYTSINRASDRACVVDGNRTMEVLCRIDGYRMGSLLVEKPERKRMEWMERDVSASLSLNGSLLSIATRGGNTSITIV